VPRRCFSVRPWLQVCISMHIVRSLTLSFRRFKPWPALRKCLVALMSVAQYGLESRGQSSLIYLRLFLKHEFLFPSLCGCGSYSTPDSFVALASQWAEQLELNTFKEGVNILPSFLGSLRGEAPPFCTTYLNRFTCTTCRLFKPFTLEKSSLLEVCRGIKRSH